MIARRTLLAGLGATLTVPGTALGLPDPATPRLRRAYLDGPYGQIHVRIAEPERRGRRQPPLVLLHQTPLSGRMFERIMLHLAVGRRVIAVDTPGYGESDRPIERPSLAQYGNAIVTALTPRFGSRFDWLGYHTGAVIAADLAARHPRRTCRAVLISVPLFEPARRAALLAQLAAPAEGYRDDGGHLPPLWTGTAKARPLGQSLDDVARLVAEKQRPGPHREWALRAAMEAELPPILRRIDAPTLVIAPHDGLEGGTAQAARMIARARLLTMPEQAYGLFDAAPAALARPILGFLDARSV